MRTRYAVRTQSSAIRYVVVVPWTISSRQPVCWTG
jgi:hypothetical protein